MSISKIQETYKEIAKNRYEALSNSSRYEYLNDWDHLEVFLFDYCVKYLNIPLMEDLIPHKKPIN